MDNKYFGELSKMSSSFNATVKNTGILKNPYVTTLLFLITGVYAGAVAPSLPIYIKDLFDNGLFRFAFLFLILAITERKKGNPALAFIVAIVFVITMAAVNEVIPQGSESFDDLLEGFGKRKDN